MNSIISFLKLSLPILKLFQINKALDIAVILFHQAGLFYFVLLPQRMEDISSKCGIYQVLNIKIIIYKMISSKIILTLITLAVLLSAQTCPQLCANDCRSMACSSCYSNFSANASISTSCSCPTSMFSNNSASICEPCPITCLSCTNSSICFSCIAGYMLSNSYSCIIAPTNPNNWVSKYISRELNNTLLLPNNLQVFIDDDQPANYQINSKCSKMNDYDWLGGYGLFPFNTKVIKTTFNMPPHQWLNIRFQVAIIDKWTANTLLLEINSEESYDSTTLESPQTIWSQTYSSSLRSVDFCGNQSIPDNLAIVDAWVPHNVSSAKFRIRMAQSEYHLNASTFSLNQAYFAIRELFIRVGTCGKNCIYCSSPNQCTQCVLPYTLSNGTCICNSSYGFATQTGCSLNCVSGFYFNSTAKTCLNCEQLVQNCQLCTSTSCSTCQLGYFYHNDGLTTKCIRYCPTGFTQNRSYTTASYITAYRDQCIPCTSNCSTCIQSLCLFCKPGFIYSLGKCQVMCSISMYAFQGACERCPSNCLVCYNALTCKTCSSGYGLLNNSLCYPYCSNTTMISNGTNICNITCASSCLTCFGPNSNQCLSCSNNSLLQVNSCVLSCLPGFYQSNTSCNLCPQSCSSCSSSQICFACTFGFYYYNSKCLRICPAFYYPSIANNTNICAACQAGCERCKSNVFCLQCKNTYVLFNFTCYNKQPSSFYHDNDFHKIKACQPNCLKCSKRICHKCAFGFYLNQGHCVSQCGPNKFQTFTSFYRNYQEDNDEDSSGDDYSESNTNGSNSTYSNQTGYCSWKSPSCSNYSNGVCNKCKYFQPRLLSLGNDRGCSYNCPQFYVASSSNSCIKCPQNCRRCTPNLKCIQCLYNYVINFQELINTSNYQNSTCVLNYCQPPYFSDSAQCQRCKQGCSVCQIDGCCTLCLPGYTYNNTLRVCHISNCSVLQYSTSSACAACVSPCVSCISPTVCTSCAKVNNSQLYLFNGTCSLTCPTSYFPHPSSGQCRKCNPKCLTCSNFHNCLTCVTSFYLLSFYSEDQARCVAECPIGFWSDTAVCQSCYKDCKSCYGPSEYHCSSCYPNFVLDQWKCVYQCSLGKYKDEDGYCDWCDPSCLQCTGPTAQNCITCAQNYYISDRMCHKDQCPGATYLAIQSERICERCQHGCTFCNSPQFCRLCTPGFNLYKGWCYKQCPGNLSPKIIRFSLPDNIFLHLTQGYICSSCLDSYSSNCLDCDVYSCRQCVPGRYLFRESVQIVNQTLKEQCVTSCPLGYYVKSQQAREIPECVPCQANCNNCSVYQTCFACKAGFNLINGYCSINCPSGSYSSSNGACLACTSPCLSCVNNSTNCATCLDGYYLFYNSTSTFKTCTLTCPSSYFPDRNSGWCSKCLPTCTLCTTINSCTQCVSGYTLSNGVCQNQTTTCPNNCQSCGGQNCLRCYSPFLLFTNTNTSASSCVSTCPNGFYPNVRSCQACNSSCLTCTNTANNCSLCQNGFYLFGQSCILVCPVGFYALASQQACKPCNPNCLNCQEAICYSCKVGFYLLFAKCYSSCPAATYASVSTGQCFNCQTGCQTCSDWLNCTACSSNYVLYNSGCVSNCPNTSYVSTALNSSRCESCVSPCYTCTNQQTCVSCIPNYILNGTTCQSTCDSGYFLFTTSVQYDNQDPNYNFNTLSQCIACDSSCATCTGSSTNCQTCYPPAVLYGSQCLNICPLGTYWSLNSCIPCSPYCVACIDTAVCTICSNNTVLYSNRCFSSCPPGFYSESQTNTTQNQYVCQACSPECLTCTGFSAYQCISCSANYYWNGNGSCVSSCPKGTYSNSMLAICSQCPFTCTSCSNANACTECLSNYTLTSTLQCTNGNSCNASDCQICSPNSQTQCAQCLPNYYLVNGTCLSQCPNATYPLNGVCKNCSGNCISCNSLNCFNCSMGYYLFQGYCVSKCPSATFASGGRCQADPCLAYSSTNTCLICASPYLLYKNISTTSPSITCVLSCPTNAVQAGLYCSPCPSQCNNCISTSICTNCSSNTYLYLGICLYSCPIGTYAYNSVCQNCSSLYCSQCTFQNGGEVCTSCDLSSGSFLSNGSCVLVCPTGTYGQVASMRCNNCSQGCSKCLNSTYCFTCNNGSSLYLGQCLTRCPGGTYLESTGCLPCPTGCLRCYNSFNCSMCLSDYILFIDNTGPSCVVACQAGYYASGITTLSFILNQLVCFPCVPPCLVCITETSCTQCVSNYSLSGSSCIQTCPQGSYSSNYQTLSIDSVAYSTRICTACSSICLTCANSATNCTACQSGYLLVSNSCMSNCTSSTTYYSSATRQCNSCSSLCYSCYGPGSDNCLSCLPPRQLYAGSCFSDCPFGYFSTSKYVCQLCSSACASCNISSSNCTICQTGLFLQQQNNSATCVSSCLSTHYLNTSTRNCDPCNSTCLTCYGPTSNNCLTCPSTMYLVNQTCVLTCPPGTAPTITSGRNNCMSCPSNCVSCTFNTSLLSLVCNQCLNNLYLVNGNCSTTCPQGTYSSLATFTCISCGITGCQRCIVNSSLIVACTTCQPSYYLIDGVCHTSCPANTVASGSLCVAQPTCQGYQWNGFCLNVCPVGTYATNVSVVINGTTTITLGCSNCSAFCSSCVSSTICLQCTAGTYLITSGLQSSCVASCPSNYYLIINVCKQCPSPCLNCEFSLLGVKCLSCLSSYVQLGSTCYSACPNGYYQNGNQCLLCSSVCASCSGSSSNCTTCKNINVNAPSCIANNTNCASNQYLSSNAVCSNCSAACLTCYGGSSFQCLSCTNSTNILINGVCTSSCPSGTIRNGTACMACPANCLNCNMTNNLLTCTLCASSYILTALNGTNICVQSCSSLNSGLASYIQVGNTCQICNITGCILCVISTSNQVQCSSCSNSTVLYNQQCFSACPSGTTPSSNTCVSCPQNCLNCSSSTVCTKCSVGYSLLAGKCVANCGSGYYTLNQTCHACTIANCLSCSAAGCLSCQQPYLLTNGQCTNCISGYYFSSAICYLCSSSCQTCSVSNSNCTSCAFGLILYNSNCISACPAGFYANSTSCAACTTVNCQSCTSSGCSSCISGYVGVIVSGQLTCQNSCPAFTYLASSTNTCISCSSFCSACVSSTSCTACSNSTVLHQGYCISSCPLGFVNVNQTCLSCPNVCKACTSLTNCTSCNSGLTVTNGTCLVAPNNCSNGYYLNAISSCTQCFPTCNTCSGGNSFDCLTCFTGYMLVNGVCTQNCNSGFYFSPSSSACEACSSKFANCLSCTNNSCLTCATNYIVSNGNCNLTCPNGTFLASSTCIPCPNYCLSCTSSNSCNQCLNSSIILLSGLCYTSCPAQTYFTNSTCSSCYQTCLTCTGSSSSSCTSCLTPYNLYNNTCLTFCPNSTYTSNYVCVNCSANCILCTDLYTCTNCNSPFYLINGTCRSTCPSGYYIDSSSKRCLQCVSPCLVCSSRTNCSSCQLPSILSNNTCVSNCSRGYYSLSLSSCVNCTVNNCFYCTETSCSSCVQGYYSIYQNGLLKYCQTACIDGTFTDNSTMNCSSCFSNCKICTNATWCNICNTGFLTLSLTQTSSNQCVQTCPVGFFPNSSLLTCSQCQPNCYSCGNYSYCGICSSNYYLLRLTGNTSCVSSCPIGYYTPTSIDGTGSCGQCAVQCYACIDANTCTQCISTSSVIVSGTCIPSNCVNCLACNNTNNTCTQCISGYYLFNSACRASCPDRYFADNTTQSCTSCTSNCLLCQTADTCLICSTNYMFVNGTGCQNAGLVLYGILGNMSGFTSNITKIMAVVYVSTSSLPIATGNIGSTYGPMQLCQFLFLLQGSSGGNEEVNNFLNSLSAVSYTDNTGTNDPANSNSSSSTSRLLTAVDYRASFLQTNYPVFIIMFAFVFLYIFVLLIERYNNSCCLSCPNLQQYLAYTCEFMKKRFKFIYVDSIMWISYMPFLYFAILQLQAGFASSILSSLLAIIIIIVYPLYPLFILRKLFDRSSNPAEDLVNYKAITLKQPARVNENKGLCEDVTCCAKEDTTVPLIEMSLSPYIDKVVRPIYNEFDPEYSEFRYFKLEHWKLAYAAIKYFRKLIFVFIVALCPNPVTTLSLLVVVTTIYILYLIILRPKQKLYLILELILESLLLFFVVFMLMYVTQGGASVSVLSVATHAIGFLLANSTLAIAIILNIMSYYTIFCCVVDLIRHLRVKKMEDDEKEKNFNDMLEEKDKFEIGSHQYEDPYVFDEKEREKFEFDEKEKFKFDDKQKIDDKQGFGMKKSRRRGDDEATEENDQEEHYVPYDLDQKEFNVRSSIINKKKTFDDDEDKPQDFTNLRQTKKRGRRERKKSIPIPAEDQGIASEEAMAQSKISNDEVQEVKSGLLKNRNTKYKREVNKNQVNVQKGELKQPTDKYRKRQDKKLQQPSFQDSIQALVEPQFSKKKQRQLPEQFVIDVDTHDRIAPKKQQKRRDKKQEDKQIDQINMRQRESNKKNNNDIDQVNMYDRQGKIKNSRSEKQKDLQNANMYERDPKMKNKSQQQKQLQEGSMYERNAKRRREEKEKELQNAKMVERLKKKQSVFGQFDQIFAAEQAMKEIMTKDRQKQKKKTKTKQEQSVEGSLPEASMKEREHKRTNIANLHYKGSDEEQIVVNEGKVIEAKNKYRRNVKKPENEGPQVDINAVGKDIKTKKVDRMGSIKQFAQDHAQELKYKERQGKEIQKMKPIIEKGENENNLQQASTYNRQKRVAQKKAQQKLQESPYIDTKLQEKKVSNKNKPNLFNDLDDDLVDSVEFQEQVKKPRRQNEKDDDFEQSNMAKILKNKQPKPPRPEDKRLQVSQNLQESYEDAVRKNKQQIFKNVSGNKSNLLQLGEDDEFEEVNYERPQSKIQRQKSRNKDMGLGVNSKQNSEASDNEARQIRKQRNEALKRQRKRGQLNINDGGDSSDDNEIVGQDSRRVSRVVKTKSKIKSVLNIQDKSDAEDIQNIHL